MISIHTTSHSVKGEAQRKGRPLVSLSAQLRAATRNVASQFALNLLTPVWRQLHLGWCCEGFGYIVTRTKSIIVVNCNAKHIFPCWSYFSSWVFTVYGCGYFRRFGGTCYLHFRWWSEFVGVGLVKIRVILEGRCITEFHGSRWFNTYNVKCLKYCASLSKCMTGTASVSYTEEKQPWRVVCQTACTATGGLVCRRLR
jgi:hypothetical protein